MEYDELRAAVNFKESCERITEAWALLNGYPIDRRFADSELIDAMAHVTIAKARLRALQWREAQEGKERGHG